jgi:hypothetical protein
MPLKGLANTKSHATLKVQVMFPKIRPKLQCKKQTKNNEENLLVESFGSMNFKGVQIPCLTM